MRGAPETLISVRGFRTGRSVDTSILEISAVRNAHASTTVQAGDRQVRRQTIFVRVEADHFAKGLQASFFSHSGLLLTYSTASERPRHANHGREVVSEHDHVVGVRHFAVRYGSPGLRAASGCLWRCARPGGDRTVRAVAIGIQSPVSGSRRISGAAYGTSSPPR